MSSAEPKALLEKAGAQSDEDIDLGEVAIALAAIERSGLSMDRYFNHLKKLGEEVGARHEELIKAGADDSAETQLAALKHVLADKHGYGGDETDYDNLENASLIGVIDRAKGMPIALGILYICAGRAQNWDIAGLNIPGHFGCRIQKNGHVLIFDPFYACEIMQAADMRKLVKKALGDHAELTSGYHNPMSNRAILIRLQNNIKTRLIDMEDYGGALKTVETMRLFAPDEYRLLLDAGVLCARTGKPERAIEFLEGYMNQTPDARDRSDIAVFIRQIRETMD